MNKKTSLLLTIGLAIYVVLFVVRDIIQINIPGAIFMFWFVGLLLVLPHPEMMKAIFFMMPFACGIPGYTILLSLVILIIKSEKTNAWQIIPPAIIALLEFISIAFYDFDIRIQSVISYLGFVFLFFFVLFDKDTSTDKKSCARFFCYGTTIALLIIYIPIILNHGLLALIAGEARRGLAMGFEDIEKSTGHLVMNANTIGYFSITLLSLLLLGRKKLDINSSLFYSLAVFVAIASGIFSFSRTWLLLAGVIIVLYLLNTRYRFISIALVIIAFSLILSTHNFIITSISGVFEERMQDETMETGGGRVEVFSQYNKIWGENIMYVIKGTGATHYGNVIDINLSMHNGLQQIWVCHGIIGLLVFAAAFLHYLKTYKSRKKLPFIYYLPFIACFVFDQSIQFLVPYTLMLPFLPTLYVLALNDNNVHLKRAS